MASLSTSDLEGILACLRDAAQAGAAIALDYFRPGGRTSAGITYKDGGSPVTDADMAVDSFLRQHLCAAIPDAAWLSEETADTTDRLRRTTILVVDPIDGTRGFASGDARWCVSIALVVDGRPVVGVVHAPVLDQRFEAIAGRGATCNGSPITASSRTALAGAQIAGPANFAKTLSGAIPFRIVPKIPSLACRLTHVAAGFLDGCVAATDSHDWDIAAADLILNEAGALLTNRHGSVPRYNLPSPTHPLLVGGPPFLHRALIDLLRRSDP